MRDFLEITVFTFIAFIVLALLFFGIFGGLFIKEDGAIELLKAQGFTDIKITSRQWFAVGFKGCEDSDSAKFNFEAIGPNGNFVNNLFVCKGFIFKGYTLRGK
jgi:hypothetical protein